MKAAAIGLLVAGMLAALITLVVVAPDGTGAAALILGVGLLVVGIGAASALRRGGTTFGVLLALAGCLWFVTQWNTAAVGNAALFTAALVGWGAFPVVAAHAALVYPGGHLTTRRGRIVVMAGYLTLVGLLGVVPALVFDPVAGGCQACPDNLLLVGSAPAFADALVRVGLVVGVLVVLILAAECVTEFFASSPARRRQVAVVLGAAVMMLLATAVLLVRSVGPGAVPLDRTTRVLLAVQGFSLCWLASGDVVERVRRRRALSRMARYALEIGRSARLGDMRQVLAGELGDPTLELSYTLDDGRLVDSSGAPGKAGGPARATTALAVGGDTIAVLTHRPGLIDDYRLVAGVLAPVRLTLDNERQAARARAQVAELAASQLRIIASGEAERRRLERDLHDGAQQRLVALMLTLRLARVTTTDREGGERIDAAVAALREVVAAVRRVASGIYPSVLAEAGLRAGLVALAEESPSPIEVLAVPAERPSPAKESVVYLLVATLARSGAVRVSIIRTGPTLVVELTADALPDSLADVEDRLAALGGTLTVGRSEPTASVRAELPCA